LFYTSLQHITYKILSLWNTQTTELDHGTLLSYIKLVIYNNKRNSHKLVLVLAANLNVGKTMLCCGSCSFKVILYSYLILKTMNERITDS